MKNDIRKKGAVVWHGTQVGYCLDKEVWPGVDVLQMQTNVPLFDEKYRRTLRGDFGAPEEIERTVEQYLNDNCQPIAKDQLTLL